MLFDLRHPFLLRRRCCPGRHWWRHPLLRRRRATTGPTSWSGQVWAHAGLLQVTAVAGSSVIVRKAGAGMHDAVLCPPSHLHYITQTIAES